MSRCAVTDVKIIFALLGSDVNGIALGHVEYSCDACRNIDASVGSYGEIGASLLCYERLHERGGMRM